MIRIAQAICLFAGLLPAVSGSACTVNGGTMAFGAINPLTPAATSSATTISVTCPSMTPYSISLSAGVGTFASRQMQSGMHSLLYNLYTDAALTTIWGDGTGGTTTVNGTADSTGTQHTIYGNIAWQPQARPGAYSDSVIITVSY